MTVKYLCQPASLAFISASARTKSQHRRHIVGLVMGCAMLLTVPTALAADYLLHVGRLIDGRSDQVHIRQSIHIKDQTIVWVKPGFAEALPGQTLIDLKAHTVMPGLIDLHTHIDLQVTDDYYQNFFYKNPADLALKATQYAKATLAAGFTTVRSLGSETANVSLALRDAINAGYIEGPRIFAAGKAIASTGGHADLSNGLNHQYSHLLGVAGPTQGVIDGPSEARQAVRQRYKEGSDLIKLTVTGGVLSLTKSSHSPQLMADELEAIIATAKDYDLAVAAHAHGVVGIKRAVLAGVDTIEHGTGMTAKIMTLMKQRGTFYIPTLTAAHWVTAKADSYPDIIKPKARTVGPQMQQTFAQAYKNGVNIAFGSDAGVFPHGLNAQEFSHMVDAGMPPMAAIQAATFTAAKVLRRDDQLGSIETNKVADLVAVKGDPLADIHLLTQVSFVMKAGQIVKEIDPSITP